MAALQHRRSHHRFIADDASKVISIDSHKEGVIHPDDSSFRLALPMLWETAIELLQTAKLKLGEGLETGGLGLGLGGLTRLPFWQYLFSLHILKFIYLV